MKGLEVINSLSRLSSNVQEVVCNLTVNSLLGAISSPAVKRQTVSLWLKNIALRIAIEGPIYDLPKIHQNQELRDLINYPLDSLGIRRPRLLVN